MRDVHSPTDQGRGIRSISVPPNRKRPGSVTSSGEYRGGGRPRKSSSFLLWIIVGLVTAVLLGFGASFIFEKATAVIYPRMVTFAVQNTLTAYQDPAVGDLGFQMVTVNDTASRTVPASGETHVERRASGTITVFNAYNTSVQRLIKNTRFEAADGKIYRIDQSITVPGTTKNASGLLVPGSVDAMVFADSAGPDYNKSGDTFTIPGFKGDPRYSKFYAKQKTDITDGFIGEEKIVAPADLTSAKQGIQAELSTKLQTALAAAIPTGFVLVPQSTSISYEELPQGGDASAAVISLRGTALAAIVKDAELASALAKAGIPGGAYAGEAVRLKDTKNIPITATEAAGANTKKLSLSVDGSVSVIWQIDTGAVAHALLGKDDTAFAAIMNTFAPAVAGSKASFRPFWKRTFPSNSKNIIVTLGDPKEAPLPNPTTP